MLDRYCIILGVKTRSEIFLSSTEIKLERKKSWILITYQM